MRGTSTREYQLMTRWLSHKWVVQLALLGSGAVALQGCPSGAGRFFASTAQPVLAQILAGIGSAITTALLGGGA
jgi:hypothetical protein